MALENLKTLSNISLERQTALLKIIQLGEQSERCVLTYVDTLLTAINLRENIFDTVGVPDPHPCSKNMLNFLDNDEEIKADYEVLVNCCQRHICQLNGYCK